MMQIDSCLIAKYMDKTDQQVSELIANASQTELKDSIKLLDDVIEQCKEHPFYDAIVLLIRYAQNNIRKAVRNEAE